LCYGKRRFGPAFKGRKEKYVATQQEKSLARQTLGQARLFLFVSQRVGGFKLVAACQQRQAAYHAIHIKTVGLAGTGAHP
jgi:hypothetical protein